MEKLKESCHFRRKPSTTIKKHLKNLNYLFWIRQNYSIADRSSFATLFGLVCRLTDAFSVPVHPEGADKIFSLSLQAAVSAAANRDQAGHPADHAEHRRAVGGSCCWVSFSKSKTFDRVRCSVVGPAEAGTFWPEPAWRTGAGSQGSIYYLENQIFSTPLLGDHIFSPVHIFEIV